MALQHIVRIHLSTTHSQEHPRTTSNTNEDVFAWLILAVVGAAVAATILSRYQEVILHVGWVVLAFIGSSVLSFAVLTFWRERTADRYSLWFLWSLIIVAASGYVFYLFSQSLRQPAFCTYLEALRTYGIQAFRLDAMGFLPAYQFLGLFLLVMAAGIAFLQAFALMISPLTTSNRLVFAAFRRAATFLQLWIVLAQAMAIITAGVLLSGVIVTWLSRL